MVTPAQNAERRATASPFGLIADLGCVYAAQLGWPVAYIARQLGLGVSDETARAAIIRGRRELVTRRIDPGRMPEPPAAEQPAAPQPSGSEDSIEALLKWAQAGPQRAVMLAAQVHTLLAELEALQQMRRRDNAKQYARRDARRQMIPVGPHDMAERRAYFAKVRAWALANGVRIPEGRIVPTSAIRAFEAAHASQNTDEGDPHRPG